MLPVLMYHGLHADSGAHGRYDPVYSVRPDDFARQLDWLLAHEYEAIRVADHGVATTTPRPARVAITFDDGDASNVEVALPLLCERGMTAEFFITSDFIGQPGMLGEADVRALADAGMGIGAHGRSHRFLVDLNDDELAAELRDSRTRLTDIIGRPVDTLALPGGRGGERERRAALADGYRHMAGSMPGPNRGNGSAHCLQRLAVTRTTTMAGFAALVRWRGLRPQVLRARFYALALPKRVLGNAGYERLRARLL